METLCLACASSLPPSRTSSHPLFVTPCCRRPVCPACIQANPRLARYDPCLACLAGAAVLASHHPDSVFVLGDDDDDDSTASAPAPPVETPIPPIPPTYNISPTDTIHGIALRLRLDARALCRLNNLPPSTLTTTPHLLHTRTHLVLPPSVLGSVGAPDSEDRARERAAKRLQTLTKEPDWRVAQAYVAIADMSADEYEGKRKDAGVPLVVGSGSNLEARAVERYLDDGEWEEGERRAGRPPAVAPFPYVRGHKD